MTFSTDAVGAFLIAFLSAWAFGPRVIAWLRVLKFGQNINTDVAHHQKKQGTPTMGGVLMILGVVLTTLIGLGFHHVPGPPYLAVLFVFLGHAVIGFLDDYLSVKRGKSLGLKARQKMLGQAVIAGLFCLWLFLTAQPEFTTVLRAGAWQFDLGLWYYPLAFLLILGLSNAVNLTDGLDGLAGGLSILALLGLAWTITPQSHGFDQLPLFEYALAGACLGFFWYNAAPAQVFMGDTGSLALGAALAVLGILGKQEILLLLLCIVFLMETASVMLQVSYFKMTKGRRIFKMTPLHHHFELSGWPETKVVARFWIWGILALGLALHLASLWHPGR